MSRARSKRTRAPRQPVAREPRNRSAASITITDEEWTDAEREAQRQIDERDHRNRLGKELDAIAAGYRAMHNRASRDATLGDERWATIDGLRRELKRCRDEIEALVHGAFDGEDLETATWRVLLERGHKPEHIARRLRPDLEANLIATTSERGKATRLRASVLARYNGWLDGPDCNLDELELIRVLETLRTDAIAGVEKKIEALTPRPRKAIPKRTR